MINQTENLRLINFYVILSEASGRVVTPRLAVINIFPVPTRRNGASEREARVNRATA